MHMAETNSDVKTPSKTCVRRIPCRFVLLGQVIVGMTVFYSIRSSLSLAMVAMVIPQAGDDNSTTGNVTVHPDECPGNTETNDTTYSSNEFSWSPKTQGIVLGGFFYGYLCTQIIGGHLADVFGPKIIIGGGMAISSLLTLLSPVAARWNVWALFAVRFLTGFHQGGIVPAINSLFSRWSGPHEHSTLLGFSYVGMEIGSIVSMPLTGYLCTYGFAGGWPSAFYVIGIAGCLWSIVWFIFAHDSPLTHPRISPEEKELILSATVQRSSSGIKKVASLPLKSILTSLPVWAYTVALSCSSWGFYYVQTELPSYLTNVLKLSLVQNGYILSITFTSCAVSTACWARMADYITGHGYASTTKTRKIFEVLGLIGSSAVLVLITFLGCSSLAVILCLNVATVLLEMTNAGDGCLSVEIAPSSAGAIYGLANTAGSMSGILAPLVTGIFVDSNSHGLTQWSYAFYAAAAVQSAGAVFFLIFGSAERQKWDRGANDHSILPGDYQNPPLTN